MPLEHGDEEEHRRLLAGRANIGLPLDGSLSATNPLRAQVTFVVDLPSAALWEGAFVFVSDEVGGPALAVSDGTNWRRLTLGAIVT